MDEKGPIIVIENNQGDHKIFVEIFSELNFPNKILYFNSGDDVHDYVVTNNVRPFLIFLDIVLLHMNSDKLSKINYKNLDKVLNCPCLFFTTFFEQCFVIDAYSEPIQSYFVQPYDYLKFKKVINTILEYWQQSKSIKSYNVKHMDEKELEK